MPFKAFEQGQEPFGLRPEAAKGRGETSFHGLPGAVVQRPSWKRDLHELTANIVRVSVSHGGAPFGGVAGAEQSIEEAHQIPFPGGVRSR